MMTQETLEYPVMSPGKRPRQEVGDYWLGKTLGQGTSGCVKMGVHKLTGEKVAIKIIPKSYLATNQSASRSVKREIAVMKLMKHPYIISLIDVIDLSDSPNLYLILEYVQGGELFEHLIENGRLNEDEARKYFQQIIIGLDYCHRHLICHRDLKPENLLLDNEKNIKIADFGMASLQPTGSLLETCCGSPHYASPEVGLAYDGSASDIWSCGVILFTLLSGCLPFDYDDIRQLLRKVKRGKYKIPPHVSPEARDLIQKILVINPKRRLTINQVRSHPWYTSSPEPNLSILPNPPAVSDIGRPVEDISEIDANVFETLKALWTELSTTQIMEELLNEEYNMQKVTYVLLQRHAKECLETKRNSEVISALPKQRPRPVTICVFPKDNEPLQSMDVAMNNYQQEKVSPQIQQSRSFSQSSENSLVPVSEEASTINIPSPVPTNNPYYDKKPERISWRPSTKAKRASWFQPVMDRLYHKPPQYLPSIKTNDYNPNDYLMFQQLQELSCQSPRAARKMHSKDGSSVFDPIKKRQSKVEPTSTPSHVSVKQQKRSSWIPGLFHLKQNKVYTLECRARDEKGVIGALSRVLHKYMNGSLIEIQESDGRIRRKGDMMLVQDTRAILLKFKLETYQLLIEKEDIYRVNFIQQNGDSAIFAEAIDFIDKALKMTLN